MNDKPSSNIPTVLVVFGGTGNLMAKKIVPALYHLFEKDELPDKFYVVGLSRKELSDSDFQKYVEDVLSKHPSDFDTGSIPDFLKLFKYHKGDLNNIDDYHTLSSRISAIDDEWGVCSNKLFYLSVPPSLYTNIFENLSESGLTNPCSPEEGWTRVLVEKPFGKNCETARDLDKLLGTFFKEEQIYRIDHYLAKEMLQNILVFRFSNNLFEETWDKDQIEEINIKLFESVGAEDRGAFYDGVGALRDVGQNHLLQMLSLVTMSYPGTLEDSAIRNARAQILQTLPVLSTDEIKSNTFRAQYDGYRDIGGVDDDSKRETYFYVNGHIDNEQWNGVSFTMESGKRMGKAQKEIEVVFRHPELCLCPKGKPHHKNKIIFRLEPKESIEIEFWSKKPGNKLVTEERVIRFDYRQEGKKSQYTEEYEKLLLDCIEGDQTLFSSSEEVEAMWKFIDPIIEAWEKDEVPLETYKADSANISTEARQVVDASREDMSDKQIGIVGLGKMGLGLSERLLNKGWDVVGYNTSDVDDSVVRESGFEQVRSLQDMCSNITSKQKIVWLMVPATAVEDVLFGKDALVNYLNEGDIVIDGGNSFFKDSADRYKKMAEKGISYVDAGVSGGPEGARRGSAIMVGGDKKTVSSLSSLFTDLSVPSGFSYVGDAGAGHFVKMVHNGIEYGMMQSIAEGFNVLNESDYDIDLKDVVRVYNHGSVIESRLIDWLGEAFIKYGQSLDKVSGSVSHSGEGQWTVDTAKEMGLEVKVIEDSLEFRKESKVNPSYTGKILSALRNMFGGHDI